MLWASTGDFDNVDCKILILDYLLLAEQLPEGMKQPDRSRRKSFATVGPGLKKLTEIPSNRDSFAKSHFSLLD